MLWELKFWCVNFARFSSNRLLQIFQSTIKYTVGENIFVHPNILFFQHCILYDPSHRKIALLSLMSLIHAPKGDSRE